MRAPLVAVTGASGFVGRSLVLALAEQGNRIRVLLRRDPVHEAWRGIQPEVVIGTLEDEACLDRLCKGADVLVHAAALIKAGRRESFEAVNEFGARRAAIAADRAGVSRMVLVSSLAAREPQLSGYARSKRAGETAAAEVLGARLCVVRPPALYGPGDVETFGLFQLARMSPFLPVFDVRAKIAMMHVHDAAEQIAFLATSARQIGLASLSDSRPAGYGWSEIMQAASLAVGVRPKIVRAPVALLSVAGVAGSLSRWLGFNPLFTLGKSKEVRHLDWSVAPEERLSDLPQPRFELLEGFTQTADWWRGQGKLSGARTVPYP